MSNIDTSVLSGKHKIAARAAREIQPGQVINLGIGIPTLMLQYLPGDFPAPVHSENGVLGMGRACARDEADRMLIDAGGTYIHTREGVSFFDSAVSFAIIRRGRLDVAFLGTLEVAENGDLANWIVPGKTTPGVGGGMELAQKARKVIVTTTHENRKGAPKLLPRCTLPLTAPACVDVVVTELAVIDVTEQGFALRELAEGADLQDVQNKTGAELHVPYGAEERIPRF